MRRGIAALLVFVMAMSGSGAHAAPAAAPAVAARLEARLDPATASTISEIVERSRASGLPTEPLVAKALEGASKGAPGPRIVTAVRQYAMALAAAREALGADAREPEIVAAAGALSAGVPADTLARLRASRPGQSLVIPLVVLADLVARKVPPDAASGTILAASRAGAGDAELLRLRERVEQDIRAGASPLTAATVRGRALLGGLRGPIDPPAGMRR